MLVWRIGNMITVRLATMEDAEDIARETSSIQYLHNEALPLIFKQPSADLFPPRKLAASIHDSNSIVAVAEIDGNIVGHIYGAIVNRAENEFNRSHKYLYIHQIGVDEEARRKGVSGCRP
jgi:predicted GNAT superfamily acetyltransferase